MDLSIGQNEKNLITVRVGEIFGSGKGLFQQWGKVGGPCELHVADGIHIATHQITEALDFWVSWVVVNGETVDCLVAVDVGEMRLGPEPKGRDPLIGVIVFDDVPNALQDELILGWLLGNIVKRVGAGRDAVGSSEIDCSDQIQLKATFEIVDEVWSCYHLVILKGYKPRFFYFGVQKFILLWPLAVLKVPSRDEYFSDELMVFVSLLPVPALHLKGRVWVIDVKEF